MKNALRILVILLVVVFILLMARRAPQHISAPREEVWLVMGTVASLRTPASEREHFPEMLHIAQKTFEEANAALSVYNPKSELSILHTQGYLEPISDVTRMFLHTTIEMTDRMQGLFDPTLLPVIQLWGFSGGDTPATLPTPEQISHALVRPTLADLQLTTTAARFPADIGHIDPGGIAKGFALDLAFDSIVQAFPDAHFLLNLGGEMRARGEPEPNRTWRIGIQHPFDKEATIGVIHLPSNLAVATSGHYERYFKINETRYAHIIDPSTGWPVQGMAGVTVLAPNATEADVLSTALFVAGLERAGPLLETFATSEAILIPDRHPVEIHITAGMKTWFEPSPAFRDNVRLLPEASHAP